MPVYSLSAAGTCMRVLTRSKGLLLTAPNAPVTVPARNLFHAGAGVFSSRCIAFSIGANRPMRNMFLDDSRIMATGKPRYSPGNNPSCLHTSLKASTMSLPYLLPGSWVRVLARSMGLVPMTARQLATPAFGIDSQFGSFTFSSWASIAALCAALTLTVADPFLPGRRVDTSAPRDLFLSCSFMGKNNEQTSMVGRATGALGPPSLRCARGLSASA
mmetsp:Transcript_2690/g.10515  ORF Transcript_2690/g.10515 Transcript_2690/m.10515 type:complete len:216 (-) Transcript_2690:77-724(-)